MFTGRCLLKLVICCVRVSNHVPCRRVALLASRAARRGAGADVDWFCRLQRRHADAASQNNLFQSLCVAARSHRLGAGTPAVERRELPQYSRPQAQYQSQPLPPPIAAPQSYPTAQSGVSGGGRGLASYAPPTHRRSRPPAPSRRARSRPSAHRLSSARAAPRSSSAPAIRSIRLSRRYNVSSAAILQANGYKGPRALSPGQQLIIPRQTAAVAAPAPALAAPASKPVAVALPRRRFMSSIAATRCSASPAATTCRWPSSPRPTTSIRRPSSSSAEAHRARREDRRGGARRAAGRGCRRSAGAASAAPAPNGRAGRTPPQSARLASATTKVEDRPRPKRRSRPAKQPARCRHSAGRCAAG